MEGGTGPDAQPRRSRHVHQVPQAAGGVRDRSGAHGHGLPDRGQEPIFVSLVLNGHGFRQRLNSTFEFGQVVVDGSPQNRMVCVEVTVSQVIAHARDLGPWDGGLGTEQLGGQRLHGFTDFQQPDPDGVEYQAVGQVTSLQMGPDGIMTAWMSASRCRSR